MGRTPRAEKFRHRAELRESLTMLFVDRVSTSDPQLLGNPGAFASRCINAADAVIRELETPMVETN